jgi:gas vesicle structural protein
MAPALLFTSSDCENVVMKGGEKRMAKVMNSTDSSSLAEVVDRILDKGIVIDAWAKVSLVGIELLSIEARVVVASVETYLKYAEAIGLTAVAAAPNA